MFVTDFSFGVKLFGAYFFRAEFAERSVDKLEATIDGLLEALMAEKLVIFIQKIYIFINFCIFQSYRNLSEKLDKTLNDMMALQ